MISAELNQRITQVGPGTPAGNLLRRYWHPVAGLAELKANPVKKVRLLGENLALFRDASGELGLVGEKCPHRGCSLAYGVPDELGLRCAYHGWLFSRDGACVDQPAEPSENKFRDRVVVTAYKVAVLGGLVFAYVGPDPAPSLPRFDLYARDGLVRTAGYTIVPCNWLQIMENSLDPIHFEWLHGQMGNYQLKRLGLPLAQGTTKKHVKIGFDEFEYGIIKRRVGEGMTEEDDEWKIGHPMVFPNILRVGRGFWNQFQVRVPIDDENTLIWWYSCFTPPEGKGFTQADDEVPVHEVPYANPDGTFRLQAFEAQDMMAWITQGQIADRTTEHLGTSDRGIILFRRMVQREIAAVEKGEDPIGTIRDPSVANSVIELPQERDVYFRNGESVALDILRQPGIEFSPIRREVVAMYDDGPYDEQVTALLAE